jgi:putative peptide zinc metalloprotease protein
VVKALKSLSALPATQERRGSVYGTLAATVIALVLLLAVVPVPFRTQAEGVVWLPEQAIVRAGAPGFFRAFEAAPDTWVEPGQVLARSVDPALDAQVRLLQARVDELEASYAAEFVNDRARAEIVRDQLEHERAALHRAVERTQGLRVAATSAGRFTVQQAADMPGRHLKQGEVIGYVIGDAAPVIRVVLDQASVEAVATSTRAVEIRRSGALDEPLRGRILRQVPSGRDEVPSQALAAGGGGRIATDPSDPKGRRTLERVFELDVGFVAAPEGALPFGQLVHLRFDHPPEPLATQAWRSLRRLFLRHFDV